MRTHSQGAGAREGFRRDYEYEIERDSDTVARISKKVPRVRETYGVEIGTGEDEALADSGWERC